MPKTLLDIGNCIPDHAAIRALITGNFDAQVFQAHTAEDAIPLMKRQPFDLVLINRKLDQDYSDGLNVLRMIKADFELASTPVMLITNHAEHQQAALTEGAEPGFGKLELQESGTLEKLARFLR
jgi:CheY-like chemotaxis protein